MAGGRAVGPYQEITKNLLVQGIHRYKLRCYVTCLRVGGSDT